MNGMNNMNNMTNMNMNKPVYMPLNQNNGQVGTAMLGNQQIAFIQYPQNGQIAMQNTPMQMQNFNQTAYKQQGSFSPSKSNSNSNNSNNFNENVSNMEEMMRNMQEKLTDMLFTQNKMITDLREKNELVQDTLACLINEVCDLKQIVKKNCTGKEKDSFEKPMIMQQTMVDNNRETASTEGLIQFLYGGPKDFPYQLIFITNFLYLFTEKETSSSLSF